MAPDAQPKIIAFANYAELYMQESTEGMDISRGKSLLELWVTTFLSD